MTTRRVSGRAAAIVLAATVLIAGLIGFGVSALMRGGSESLPTATPRAQTANVTVALPTSTPLVPFTPSTTSAASPVTATVAAIGTAPPVATVVPTTTAVAFDAEQLYAAVSPAVVTISNKAKINPNASALREINAGSGIIYDARGYLLTNRHVIEGAEAIDVTLLSGKTVAGTLVGQDPVADLAVIRIDPAVVPGVASFGDSSLMRPGQRVIAIGSPLNFAESVSRGIISGTERTINGLDGMLQTDAPISPGNSGGPLVNARGEVVGIATSAMRPDQGERLGFAIPSNTAQRIAAIIVANGKVTRPYLGVITELLTPARGEELNVTASRGAYIGEVTANTPAAQVGLKKGDVIVRVNGAVVDRGNPLSVILLGIAPGETVTLTINRDGTEQQIPVTLIERPAALDP